jgi:hypothetical protein
MLFNDQLGPTDTRRVMMVRNLTFSDVERLDDVMDFVTGEAARLANRRDAAGAKASCLTPGILGITPAGRTIATGRDLLRCPFPLGWSSR